MGLRRGTAPGSCVLEDCFPRRRICSGFYNFVPLSSVIGRVCLLYLSCLVSGLLSQVPCPISVPLHSLIPMSMCLVRSIALVFLISILVVILLAYPRLGPYLIFGIVPRSHQAYNLYCPSAEARSRCRVRLEWCLVVEVKRSWDRTQYKCRCICDSRNVSPLVSSFCPRRAVGHTGDYVHMH